MSELSDKLPVGSALKALIAGLDEDLACPRSETPHAIRRRLANLLQSSDLCVDCVRLFLSQLVHEADSEVLYLDPRSRYALQMFCWPAGFGNQPHLHVTWTVSAVMASSLQVFRSQLSEEDCLASKPLLANAGEVGVLMPPQFHCLRNISNETAITFHVFSMGEASPGRVHQERSSDPASRVDDEGILAMATLAARYRGPRTFEIIRIAFAVASNAAKLQVVKLMAKLDPLEAARLGRTLCQIVGGQDGLRLLTVLEKLEMSAREAAG